MRESAQSPCLVSSLRRGTIIFLSCITIIGVGACARAGGDSAIVQFAMAGANTVQVRDLRFYVHDIELLDAQGSAYPFRLTPSATWQTEAVALVDLSGASDADRNGVLRGTITNRPAHFSGIRFTVGVPFELNHGNPLNASAPLNAGDLFWTWQSGYKFMRIDLADSGAEWSFHLGSTGCASASAVRAPEHRCAQPNLMRVELHGFDPLRVPIQVRLNELIESMRAPASGTCTGGYAHEQMCAHVFAKTGLNPTTGSCDGGICAGQRIFGFGK
jgi:uncharacterized repeat protein (TIGR04052 family)